MEIPSHIGIDGNESPDKAGKKKVFLTLIQYKIPYTDLNQPLKNIFMTNGKNHGTIKCTTSSTINKIPSMSGRSPVREEQKRSDIYLTLH